MSTNVTPRRRMAKTAAAAAFVLGVTALPAAATMIMQNFIEADIQAAPACMVKTAGADAGHTSGLVTFNTTNTQSNNATDGVQLLNETFTIKALKGDRLISSSAGVITNNCTYPLTVSLVAEGQLGDAMWEGSWTDISADLYLGTANGTATTDFSNASAWLTSPIHANSTGVTDTQTGSVTLAPNDTALLGWLIDAGTSADTTTSNAVLRFTVSGQPA